MGKVWWTRLHLDPLLVVCFAALFAFPIAAAMVADAQPVDPAARTLASTPTTPVAKLRELPAFSPGSAVERRLQSDSLLTEARAMRAAIASALRDVVGPRRSADVVRLVQGDTALEPRKVGFVPVYPYRFPRLEPLLEGASRDPARVNDVGSLLMLAAAGESAGRFGNAASVAFALLDRARDDRSCMPQRNLALLVSTDPDSDDDVVRNELDLAGRLCRGDPTPAWILGQHQAQKATSFERESVRRPLATFRRLQQRLPGSALGWSGEADLELRLAYEHEANQQPFTARARLRRALELYERAQRLDRDPGLAAGAARALAGMREFDAAVREQRRAVAGRATLLPVAVRYIDYLERDREFAAAARATRPIVARPRFASGRALIKGEASDGDEDLESPLSIGVDRLLPVKLSIARAPSANSPPAVIDLSFIPEFRELDALTGRHRWCPGWSLPRDLLLSGDPGAALAALPDVAPVDLASGEACVVELAPVRAMAALEAHDEKRALREIELASLETALVEVIRPWPTSAARALSDLFDTQQNMWRFAGELGRAEAAAQVWMQRIPQDARAADRLGEIAFLDKRYEDAARWFARSVRLTRSTVTGWTAQEAFALLKRATALSLGDRRREALAVLEQADEIASRAEAQDADGTLADANRFASYHARVQTGDALLREERFADAAEAYVAARERQLEIGEDAVFFSRPEALQNNQAIAETKVGNGPDALAAADKALLADPGSPIFLETRAYALRRAGRHNEAVRDYRAAVAADPTAITAWNDLGVVLAREGRLDEAVHAFRRAVGVRADYALGWFNLGVAQARRGVAHALASQGAFGRAFRADESLRDRKRRFIADDAVYFTNLDLSKPLPAGWSYAQNQERAPVTAAGFALFLLLGLRLGRRMLASRFGGDLAGKLIDPLTLAAQRFPRLPMQTPWILAVLATIAVFASGLLRPGAGGAVEALVLMGGVLALIIIVLRGRSLAARRAGVRVAQRGWTPGIAIGTAAAAFGTAWAPLPVAEPSEPAPEVHWVGPVLTGLAALGLLVLAAWLAIPGTSALAAAAIVMTASLLTPTKPLDGGYVATGTAGIAAGLALLGGGLFFLLGVG